LTGLRAKIYQKKRHHQKIQLKKQIKAHEERNVKSSALSEPSSTPIPQYLLDRSNPTNAKALSSAIKNKRNEKAAKFSVPLPKVRGISEEEMFKVVKTGKKTAKKGWKRMITKPTFVGPDFTRRPVKYALHPAHGSPVQEGECNASRAGSYGTAADYKRQEEPSESDVYAIRCFDEGDDH
jgi:ribosome biogenesis protein NSA2